MLTVLTEDQRKIKLILPTWWESEKWTKLQCSNYIPHKVEWLQFASTLKWDWRKKVMIQQIKPTTTATMTTLLLPKQRRDIGPMTFLRGTMSIELERHEKSCATRCRSVVSYQRRSVGPFPVVIADRVPTSDRLPVTIACRVTSLCNVLSKFLNSAY